MDLLIDFETYCEANLKEVGVTRYVNDPTFKVLCMSYKPFIPTDLSKNYPTKTWTFQNPEPLDLSNYDYYWAFNTGFDLNVYLIQNTTICMSPEVERWKDVQGVCSKFSLPQNLAQAAEVLKCNILKHPDGGLIINKCCKKNSKAPTQKDYDKLFLYCEQDVDATFEVLRSCPSISVSDYEWDLWRETFKMNYRGLPIDYETVIAIKQRVDVYKEYLEEVLPDLTDGKITKPTQTARIKKFLNDNDVPVKNTTADTLELIMEEDEATGFLSNECRQVIEIRQAGGASSVAKFNKLLDMRVGDKVHDFLRYGAQNTQRWSGAGYQVHSLPKKTVDDPEELIMRFKEHGDITSPIQSAKALCRSVIKSPTGQMLYQGDFSSIEYLLLVWMTDMDDMLKLYAEGKSAYIDMAAFLNNKKYDEIDKYSTTDLEYFMGKQVILGCGYQMGAKKFKETCAKYRVEISGAEAARTVNAYRLKYKPIKNMWDNVHKACIAAVQHPGMNFESNKCEFKCLPDRRGETWLIISLPSNTKLYYCRPELSSGKYGPELKHWGLQNYAWCHRYLSPGRITENIIQKIARDLMGYAIYTVAQAPNFSMLMTVHDELVSLGTDVDPDKQLAAYLKLLEITPEWAKGMPLRAGGFYGRRYKKD